MIAGKPTPNDARMMWNPSVNAIWLRAMSRFEAAIGRASITVSTSAEDRRVGLAERHPNRMIGFHPIKVM